MTNHRSPRRPTVAVPCWFLKEAAELTTGPLRVFLCLCGKARKPKPVSLPVVQIARATKMTGRGVQKALRQLTEKNLIECERPGGATPNRYSIPQEPQQPAGPPAAKPAKAKTPSTTRKTATPPGPDNRNHRSSYPANTAPPSPPEKPPAGRQRRSRRNKHLVMADLFEGVDFSNPGCTPAAMENHGSPPPDDTASLRQLLVRLLDGGEAPLPQLLEAAGGDRQALEEILQAIDYRGESYEPACSQMLVEKVACLHRERPRRQS